MVEHHSISRSMRIRCLLDAKHSPTPIIKPWLVTKSHRISSEVAFIQICSNSYENENSCWVTFHRCSTKTLTVENETFMQARCRELFAGNRCLNLPHHRGAVSVFSISQSDQLEQCVLDSFCGNSLAATVTGSQASVCVPKFLGVSRIPLQASCMLQTHQALLPGPTSALGGLPASASDALAKRKCSRE